jgi:hypothetical protein
MKVGSRVVSVDGYMYEYYRGTVISINEDGSLIIRNDQDGEEVRDFCGNCVSEENFDSRNF